MTFARLFAGNQLMGHCREEQGLVSGAGMKGHPPRTPCYPYLHMSHCMVAAGPDTLKITTCDVIYENVS